jgi:hypothetical protein
MRRFIVTRTTDLTGISGTGVILYGVEWLAGGPCNVYWPKTDTTGQYPSLQRLEEIHCYAVDGKPNAEVEFLDPTHEFHGPLIREDANDGRRSEDESVSDAQCTIRLEAHVASSITWSFYFTGDEGIQWGGTGYADLPDAVTAALDTMQEKAPKLWNTLQWNRKVENDGSTHSEPS